MATVLRFSPLLKTRIQSTSCYFISGFSDISEEVARQKGLLLFFQNLLIEKRYTLRF